MDNALFASLFTDDQEIGRDIMPETVQIFFDNHKDVGMWTQDRRTTICRGEILSFTDAENARGYYGRSR